MLDLKNIEEKDTKEGLYYIVISLVLGIIFDRLFYIGRLGISHFIFLSLCIIFFSWSLRNKVKFEKNLGWFLIIPIGLLSFSYSVYTNPVFTLLNIVAVPFFMVVSSILIDNPKLPWDKLIFLLYIIKKSLINVIESIGTPFRILYKLIAFKEKEKSNNSKNQILIGLLISLPLLIIIIGLLNSADMMFSYYLSNITNIFNNIDLSNILPHVIITLIIAFYLFGYVWGFNKEHKDYANILGIENISIEAVTIITVLVV